MKKLLCAFLLLFVTTLHAETFMLAAGAGYKRPVSELARQYEAASGNKVEEFYGNMAQVMTQVSQSGKVALILADLDFLQKTKEVEFAGFLPLGDGKLVLAYAKDKPLKSPEGLTDAAITRIAMPDQKNAIYGIATTEFLDKSGLASRIKGKLMVVATVPQVSAYLVSGDIDAGFINVTDALGIKDKIGGYLVIDPKTYGAIKIAGGIVKGWESKPAVKSFVEYLQTPAARVILDRHGL